MPCCEPLKRPRSKRSLNSPSPPEREFSRIARRPRLLNEQVALNGKVCRFQQQAASVSAARAAAHHHIHIFLLAGICENLLISNASELLRPVVGIYRPE